MKIKPPWLGRNIEVTAYNGPAKKHKTHSKEDLSLGLKNRDLRWSREVVCNVLVSSTV